jgi:hypothetical protein
VHRNLSLVCLIVPAFCAYMGNAQGKYAWNVGVTLGCAILLLLSEFRAASYCMIAGLLASLAGDYFMGHRYGKMIRYVYGISGFFVAHIFFVLYGAKGFALRPWAIVLGIVLLAGYSVYLKARILPHVREMPLRIAITCYMLVSVLALFFALSMQGTVFERILYILGIACIVFSDTVIGETDFVGTQGIAKLIMPTYYACHILITASVFFKSNII